MTSRDDLQRANLDLLIQLDRLLTEADKARTMRDRLLNVARQSQQPTPPKRSPNAQRAAEGDHVR